MKIGQEFIHKKTGRRAKIVEIKPTMEKGRKGKLITRYRLNEEEMRFLTVEQLRALYAEAVQGETKITA